MANSGGSDRESRAPSARTLAESSVGAGAPRVLTRTASDARIVPPVEDADVARHVDAVRFGGESASMQLVAELLERGVTAEQIFLDLLAPGARRFGELWCDDSCDFLDVTVALGRIQRVLRSLSRNFLDEETGAVPAGTVLLTALPGFQHTLGLFMVAEFFVRDGWQVSMGWPVSHFDLHTAVRADWLDVVAFSVSCDDELPRLTAEIKNVRRHSRNPRVQILVGGRIFEDAPALVARIGADAGTADARQAAILAAQLLRVASP